MLISDVIKTGHCSFKQGSLDAFGLRFQLGSSQFHIINKADDFNLMTS